MSFGITQHFINHNTEPAQQHFHLFHSFETNSYKSQNVSTYCFQLEDQQIYKAKGKI